MILEIGCGGKSWFSYNRKSKKLCLDLHPMSASLNFLRIATRESHLALCQAEQVKALLQQHYPDLNITLVGLTTEGDRQLDTSLQKIGGKGLFVKELETSLLNRTSDIAVHSAKDIPAELPSGLTLTTFYHVPNHGMRLSLTYLNVLMNYLLGQQLVPLV